MAVAKMSKRYRQERSRNLSIPQTSTCIFLQRALPFAGREIASRFSSHLTEEHTLAVCCPSLPKRKGPQFPPCGPEVAMNTGPGGRRGAEGAKNGRGNWSSLCFWSAVSSL